MFYYLFGLYAFLNHLSDCNVILKSFYVQTRKDYELVQNQFTAGGAQVILLQRRHERRFGFCKCNLFIIIEVIAKMY